MVVVLVFAGKSLAAWYALCFLSAVKNKIVVYFPLKSAAAENEYCFAILVGQFVLQVTARSKNDLMVVFGDFLDQTTLVTCPLDIKMDCVFLDGFFHEQPTGNVVSMKALAQRLQKAMQKANKKRPIPFLGATTSMMTHEGGCFHGDLVQRHHSEPWDLEDYIGLVRAIYSAGTTLSAERLLCLGCTEADTSLADIEAAIQAKYRIAGHSCRFMFDCTCGKVREALRAWKVARATVYRARRA